MPKGFCLSTAALAILLAAAIAPATAQFPPTPDEPAQPPLAGTPKAKAKGKKAAPAAATPVASTGINGTWAGELTQVGSQNPYKIEIAITARGAETKYPDLDCTGNLTRAGASRTYTFFVEVIGKGRADKGGRCPDGTITVARQGNDLALGWFGSVQDSTVVAFGTLKKK